MTEMMVSSLCINLFIITKGCKFYSLSQKAVKQLGKQQVEFNHRITEDLVQMLRMSIGTFCKWQDE